MEIGDEEIVILNRENMDELVHRTGLSRALLEMRFLDDQLGGNKSAYFFRRIL